MSHVSKRSAVKPLCIRIHEKFVCMRHSVPWASIMISHCIQTRGGLGAEERVGYLTDMWRPLLSLLYRQKKKRATLPHTLRSVCVCLCVCVCVYYICQRCLPAFAMACSEGKTIPNALISYFTSKQTLSTPDSPGAESYLCM